MGIFSSLLGKKDEGVKKPKSMVMPVIPSEIYKAATLELQDIIAPSALQITPKNLNLGDKIARTFFVISYPRYLTDNWFSPIINLERFMIGENQLSVRYTRLRLSNFKTSLLHPRSRLLLKI
jgi:hypothetical protein